VEDSDDTLFTRHTFFVFFGGAEVGEALAGVFLISVFFSPLALLISFAFFGWWRPLNAMYCSQCFLIVVMMLSTLGLVGATFSSCIRVVASSAPSFLILHQVTLLFFRLEFEFHIPSPYAEVDLSGSDINPCIDIY
jgi:hypothetical protein